ncbi:Peroxisomal sarcosine oxidase [Toxocara canis]|uniref:Peroxisomal sarcosine oxidase n=1 Tax=Toxocara canis TaxID=6265 RepID=A0A0B2UTY2_TOXCA|nr:Peroxisomal sarcosine oxidase [Toxocara canis]
MGNEKFFDVNANSPVLIITKDDDLLYAIPGVDYKNKIKFGVHDGKECDPSKRVETLPDRVCKQLSEHISKHFPDVDPTQPFHADSCMYTMSEDEHFILALHPTYSNVIIGGGFSGMGFKFGLTVGQILARMAANIEGNEEFDLTAFKLNRYSSNTV